MSELFSLEDCYQCCQKKVSEFDEEKGSTFNSFHILELLFQTFGQHWTLLNLRGIGVQHLESIFYKLVMHLKVVFLSSSKS
jgi:hypothetical protein